MTARLATLPGRQCQNLTNIGRFDLLSTFILNTQVRVDKSTSLDYLQLCYTS